MFSLHEHTSGNSRKARDLPVMKQGDAGNLNTGLGNVITENVQTSVKFMQCRRIDYVPAKGVPAAPFPLQAAAAAW